jgi:hypothetical protein
VTAPRAVDQKAAHRLGRDGKEMRAVLPANISLIDEAQIRLVNERRRLERVVGAFAPARARRDPAQFPVHERNQGIEGVAVALLP